MGYSLQPLFWDIGGSGHVHDKNVAFELTHKGKRQRLYRLSVLVVQRLFN